MVIYNCELKREPQKKIKEKEMEITNIRTLIENKLACLDIYNKDNKEIVHNDNFRLSRFNHELTGIKQILRFMGIDLQLNINPYIGEDGIPSTYTLKFN